MKLLSVNTISTNNKQDYRNTNNNQTKLQKNTPSKANQKVAFTGGAGSPLDAFVKFWQVVDQGGRALQFTVEDMFGTNFPRSYKGLTAGKKYTGKYNWVAFAQEAIREFLTGPTMTFFPVIALAFSKHQFGQSANIRNENVNNLSHLLNGVNEGTVQEVSENFLTKVSKDLLDKTLDSAKDSKVTEAENKELATKLKEYLEVFNTVNNTKGEAKKLAKTNLKEKETAAFKTFEDIIKKNKADFADTNFQTVKYSISDTATGSADFKEYIDYAASYIHDYVKQNTADGGIVKTNSNLINGFKNNLTGKRLFTMFNMIILTGLLMRQIPKLYTKATGKVNPNAVNIYNEASNRKNHPNEKSEEVNNA